MKTRIISLDILRGLAALSILIFHYLGYALDQKPEASNVLPRMGFYGVSIFYVLSGLTLALVYQSKLIATKDISDFFRKRIARIFPLMIAVIFLTFINTPVFSLKSIFLNITGLFGFFAFDNYIGQGMWSIGNELVFYLFFPIVLYLFENKKNSFFIIYLISFLLMLTYSFFDLNSSVWINYINPANQIFYFISGIVLSTIRINSKYYSNFFLPLFSLLFVLMLFAFYPVEGSEYKLIHGFNRVIFSICCILICLIFFKSNLFFNENAFFVKLLVFLGEISYGIYLLHPLVYGYIQGIIKLIKIGPVSSIWVLPTATLVTILLSYLSYNYFEKKMAKVILKYK
jgi:peptidoglycan/LPS O-acetylase OafA/YrhL